MASYEVFVGLRYLMAKRRGDVLSIITLISVAGVAVGVMAMIVVLSVMGGFENDLKTKILGTKTHVVVTGRDDALLSNPDELVTSIRSVPGVSGAAPFIQSEVMISSPTNLSGVVVKGIDPEQVTSVSDLERNLVDGDLGYLDAAGRVRRGSRGLSDPEELDRLLDELETSYDLDELPGGDGGRRYPGVDGKIYDGKNGDPVVDQGASEDFRRRFIRSDSEGAGGKTMGGEPKWARSLPGIEAKGLDGGDTLKDAWTDEPADGYMPPLPGQPAKEESAASPSETWTEEPPDGYMPPLPGQEPPADTAADKWPDDPPDGYMPPLPSGAGGRPDNTVVTPVTRRDIPGLIIGRELKKTLQVDVGSEINVVSPSGDLGPTGPIPRSRPFKVVGVFYSGMYEYDTKFVYMSIPAAQTFLNYDENKVTGIEVKTEDVDKVRAVRDAVRAELKADEDVGPMVRDWQDLNSNLFAALKLEKIVMFIILVFIILVASFSIVCNLVMMVIEKAREVAILKSMGATNGGVMRIFMLEGTVIGVMGTLIGLVLGITCCLIIEFYGIKLDPDVYYISNLPVQMNWVEILLISVSGIAASIVATIYPSIQAARLAPVDGLRYE